MKMFKIFILILIIVLVIIIGVPYLKLYTDMQKSETYANYVKELYKNQSIFKITSDVVDSYWFPGFM